MATNPRRQGLRRSAMLSPALTRYCNNGRLEIDNNTAERTLRAVALGRKNYLFAGSDAGGERAANLCSLIGSAKLNRLDPESYLRDVLTRIAEGDDTLRLCRSRNLGHAPRRTTCPRQDRHIWTVKTTSRLSLQLRASRKQPENQPARAARGTSRSTNQSKT